MPCVCSRHQLICTPMLCTQDNDMCTAVQAKAAYKQACEQFEAKQEALQALISRRELAHQALLVPGSVPADPGGPDAGKALLRVV